jgi:lipoprotein-releasing system permease protein
MRLTLKIARRYLLARRSTNAINIITGMAILGVTVGSAALILILSVFNGFEDLFLSLYNNFNPDLQVTLREGKTFEVDSSMVARLEGLDGITLVSATLEETAFFQYKDNQTIGKLKGIDDHYVGVTGVDTTVREGAFGLYQGARPLAVVGLGIRNKLGIDVTDTFSPLTIYMPKRKRSNPFDTRPLNSKATYPVGTFLVQQDFENQYVLTSLAVARELLNLPRSASSLEIKLAPGYDLPSTYAQVQEVVGEDFVVKNRLEQEAAFLRLMKIEKWLSFAIVGLMMLLVSFNLIGALWMIVLEKQKDISILRSMGLTEGNIRRLFLQLGLLLTGLGILIGFVLAATIYVLQKTVGIIALPGGMLIDAYPVSLRWWDFPLVTLTVLAIGWLAALLPARRAARTPAIMREEGSDFDFLKFWIFGSPFAKTAVG